MSKDHDGPRPAIPDDPEDADPGLAAERTELAWTRSSLAFAAVGVAVLKLRPALGIPILVFGAVVWVLGHLLRTPGRAPAASRKALLVTVGVTTLAAASLVITLVGTGAGGIRLH